MGVVSEFVVIAGMSGAGRSQAANSLEDLGWFVIDNLPPPLIPKVAELAAKLQAGNFGWGHAKEALYEALEVELGPKRAIFNELRADERALDRALEEGEERARKIARTTIDRVRKAIGIA